MLLYVFDWCEILSEIVLRSLLYTVHIWQFVAVVAHTEDCFRGFKPVLISWRDRTEHRPLSFRPLAFTVFVSVFLNIFTPVWSDLYRTTQCSVRCPKMDAWPQLRTSFPAFPLTAPSASRQVATHRERMHAIHLQPPVIRCSSFAPHRGHSELRDNEQQGDMEQCQTVSCESCFGFGQDVLMPF